MNISKTIFASLFVLAFNLSAAAAAPVPTAAPDAAPASTAIIPADQPSDVFNASLLSDKDCAATGKTTGAALTGGYCGNCGSGPCRNQAVGAPCDNFNPDRECQPHSDLLCIDQNLRCQCV